MKLCSTFKALQHPLCVIFDARRCGEETMDADGIGLQRRARNTADHAAGKGRRKRASRFPAARPFRRRCHASSRASCAASRRRPRHDDRDRHARLSPRPVDTGFRHQAPGCNSCCISAAASIPAFSASIRPTTVRWFDVDFPDVMTLRRTLYPDRANYTQIASSVTERGMACRRYRMTAPAIVVAEGVLPYLAAEDVYDLLAASAGTPAGGRGRLRRL